MEINDPRVPPGFRFHPTEEELVGYYLKRKINSLKIDLDVIVELDLYRMEPWDFQVDRCKLGYDEQNEWYFFSHKDKKYPTGTRTNRATAAGFWKATGRDKAVLTKDNIMIGMRKTLVFYKGRAPNGRKTDWIMHEYRLQTTQDAPPHEEGWVVCRAFRKPSPATTHQYRPFYGFEPAGYMNRNGSNIMMDRNHQYSNMMMNVNTSRNVCLSPIPDLASPTSLSTIDSIPGSASMASGGFHTDFINPPQQQQQNQQQHQYYHQQENQLFHSNNSNKMMMIPSNHPQLDIPSNSGLVNQEQEQLLLLNRNTDHNNDDWVGDDCKGTTGVNWKFLDSLLASSSSSDTNNNNNSFQPSMLLNDYNTESYCDQLTAGDNDDQLGNYLSCFPNL